MAIMVSPGHNKFRTLFPQEIIKAYFLRKRNPLIYNPIPSVFPSHITLSHTCSIVSVSLNYFCCHAWIMTYYLLPQTTPWNHSFAQVRLMKICIVLVHNIFNRSQQNFAHVTTVTLSWSVQNFVVIGWAHFKPEHCVTLSNFKFNRDTVIETGTWPSDHVSDRYKIQNQLTGPGQMGL